MKLIDLLVKELQRRGGWPDGVSFAWQDEDGEVRFDVPMHDFYPENKSLISEKVRPMNFIRVRSDTTFVVTRAQYEAALAKNDDRLEQDLNECIGQGVDMPEWNGDGVPPVGVECEYKFPHVNYQMDFRRGKVLAYGNKKVFMEHWSSKNEFIQPLDNIEFRPLRTEAEKAREKLAASLHAAAGASPIELNGIGPLYFKLADAIISGIVFGTTFKENK